MRAVTAAFVFVVAAMILFGASFLLVGTAIACWMHDWAGWPNHYQPLTLVEGQNVVSLNFYRIIAFSVLAGGVGGFIFALSCLTDWLDEVLLGTRRGITFVYLFTYAFPIFYAVLVTIAVAAMITLTNYEVKSTVDPNHPVPHDDAVKMAEPFLAALPSHILYANIASLAVAFMSSLWICSVLSFTDWLPWCSGESARRSRRARSPLPSARRSL